MREALEREAEIHQRSLSAEIIHRLRSTLEGLQVDYQPQQAGALQVREPRSDFAIGTTTLIEAKAAPAVDRAAALSDAERMALALFRGMPPEKQLALLTVLKR
jgi:hypothetical protein